MFESVICLKRADCAEKVAEIVNNTIKEVYPHYYPIGAVQFFLNHHSLQKIRSAIKIENVYYFMLNEKIIGTGSIFGNEICRLFILPKYQGKGYGSKMMDLLEKKIFEKETLIHIDASFPAEAMYLKRGYTILSYETIKTENGDFLCYHTMEKKRNQEIC